LLTGATTPLAPTLDFRGRDILLLSVDALRADHVGAYGYTRATTPNIDRLANQGVRFDAAFSPTPHTSYAVTSMMTGKYMRPLLALGLGQDSDTWAGLLRKYGYRTAAFYPPAVFFIDEALFGSFRDRGLDFEYRKVEFATAELRAKQTNDYLGGVRPDQPLFLWLHLFEPHEPYVQHPEHPFGERPIDVYDSEIASADDAIGSVVDRVRAFRPHVTIIVTADHGEEFGEHGGRYHGTSVYDEQVRVPLILVGEGIAPGVVATPVQTIDLLPTVLSALRIPRPARVRGRDLGPFISSPKTAHESDGYAFSETEDHTLIAEGSHRYVCERRIAACALYDAASDPAETKDRSRDEPAVAARLRARGIDLARSHGRFESGESASLPEALRRALQGDREAALEAAPLLDDVRIELRRAAGRALFELAVPETAPFAARALAHDSDEEVTRWAALALVRLGAPGREIVGAKPLVEGLLMGAASDWRFRAALAFAEAGDMRGADVLAQRLEESIAKGDLSFADARAVVRVLGEKHEKKGVHALVRALEDVRLRPLAVEALAFIADPSARGPILRAFAEERYVSMRTPEARALIALGARLELAPALQRFGGVPEPWIEGLRFAEAAGILREHSGAVWTTPTKDAKVAAAAGPRRLYVRAGGAPEVKVASGALPAVLREGEVSVFELPNGEAVEIHSPEGIRAYWIVPRAEELPPPAPVPWQPTTPGRGPEVVREAPAEKSRLAPAPDRP
jgi:arylsulfatase A-like enzyme